MEEQNNDLRLLQSNDDPKPAQNKLRAAQKYLFQIIWS